MLSQIEDVLQPVDGLRALIITVSPDNLLYDYWSREDLVDSPDESATFFGDLLRVHFEALETIHVPRGDIQITLETGDHVVVLKNMRNAYVVTFVFHRDMQFGIVRMLSRQICELLLQQLPFYDEEDEEIVADPELAPDPEKISEATRAANQALAVARASTVDPASPAVEASPLSPVPATAPEPPGFPSTDAPHGPDEQEAPAEDPEETPKPMEEPGEPAEIELPAEDIPIIEEPPSIDPDIESPPSNTPPAVADADAMSDATGASTNDRKETASEPITTEVDLLEAGDVVPNDFATTEPPIPLKQITAPTVVSRESESATTVDTPEVPSFFLDTNSDVFRAVETPPEQNLVRPLEDATEIQSFDDAPAISTEPNDQGEGEFSSFANERTAPSATQVQTTEPSRVVELQQALTDGAHREASELSIAAPSYDAGAFGVTSASDVPIRAANESTGTFHVTQESRIADSLAEATRNVTAEVPATMPPRQEVRLNEKVFQSLFGTTPASETITPADPEPIRPVPARAPVPAREPISTIPALADSQVFPESEPPRRLREPTGVQPSVTWTKGRDFMLTPTAGSVVTQLASVSRMAITEPTQKVTAENPGVRADGRPEVRVTGAPPSTRQSGSVRDPSFTYNPSNQISTNRGARILEHLASQVATPQNILVRVAVHARIPLDALKQPDTLSADQLLRIEDAACTILGVTKLDI